MQNQTITQPTEPTARISLLDQYVMWSKARRAQRRPLTKKEKIFWNIVMVIFLALSIAVAQQGLIFNRVIVYMNRSLGYNLTVAKYTVFNLSSNLLKYRGFDYNEVRADALNTVGYWNSTVIRYKENKYIKVHQNKTITSNTFVP